jgi:HSP20 family protein
MASMINIGEGVRQNIEEVSAMALVPWKRGELERVRREFDRMFERFWGEMPQAVREGMWAPDIDVSETEGEFIIRGELPGIDPGELDISLAGHMLTLKGEKRREREKKGESYRLVERTYGGFSRAIELPADIDPEGVEATYTHGVLEIRLPKSEAARTKKIEVSVT